MVLNADIIDVIAEKLEAYKAVNIVIDPVMAAASGGSRLPDDNVVDTLVNRLFPLGTVITPNIPEAEALTGMRIASGVNIFSQNNMLKAAEALSVLTKGGILMKGGHLECTADDLLYCGGTARWFTSERIEHPNTRGSGSTLSAAIACNLAAGLSLEDSVKNAKAYVTGALKAGHNRGLLDHMWNV
jgi:hydroxymethylpyrimidine/phosphomethylpyrimidine kinase